MGVCHAKMQQFDAVLTVIENHVFAEEECRRFQFARCDIRARLGALLPATRLVAIITRLVFLHFFDDADMRHWRGAIFDPDLVAVGVVAMMMRIECETDRLICDGANLGKDLFRS